MSEAEMMKLFRYIQGEFKAMHKEFAEIHARFDTCFGAIDTLAKQVETYTQEMTVIGHQLSRHEGWIEQLAVQTNTKLTY